MASAGLRAYNEGWAGVYLTNEYEFLLLFTAIIQDNLH